MQSKVSNKVTVYIIVTYVDFKFIIGLESKIESKFQKIDNAMKGIKVL